MAENPRPSFPREKKLIQFEKALKQVEAKEHKTFADVEYLMRLLMDIPKPYRPPVREDRMEEIKNEIFSLIAPLINIYLDEIFPAAPRSRHFPNALLPKEGEESSIARSWRMKGWGGDDGKGKKAEKK